MVPHQIIHHANMAATPQHTFIFRCIKSRHLLRLPAGFPQDGSSPSQHIYSSYTRVAQVEVFPLVSTFTFTFGTSTEPVIRRRRTGCIQVQLAFKPVTVLLLNTRL